MSVEVQRSNYHILIVVQNLPVPFDRRVWQEATTLKEAGYVVSVICPKKGVYQASRETLNEVFIYRYPLLLEASASQLAYLVEFLWCWVATAVLSARIFASRRFHVIHACNPPDTYFLLALLYRRAGVRFVFDHHDLSPEMFLAKGASRQSILYRGLLRLERWTFRCADFVIAVNESHRRVALGRGQVPAEKTHIVRSGPGRTWGVGTPPDSELRSGFRFMVAYLGEMCAQDGVDLLLSSIRHYRRQYGDDTIFCLIGGGPESDRMRELAHSLNLDSVVRFTGRISDEMLWRYLATSDVCVDPSPSTEWANLSTMNKIIEYMAFGKPIVANALQETRYSAGGAAEYVSGGNVEDFGRAIRSLLEVPARRKEMGIEGRKRFEKVLAWDTTAPDLIQIYDRLLS